MRAISRLQCSASHRTGHACRSHEHSKLPHTVEVTITAAPARLSLVPGTTSDAFAYNGRVPGPTLEIREGDKVIVHFKNNLPVPTTIHWHGVHMPVAADGSPFYPAAPGATYDYVFTIKQGTAGTYWYHRIRSISRATRSQKDSSAPSSSVPRMIRCRRRSPKSC